GNVSEEDTDKATLDTTKPVAPTVTITEDAGADKVYGTDDKGENDGWINKDELDGTIGVKITVPADAKVGDTLTITTPDGKSVEVPITDEIKKNGHTIELDPAQFPEGEEKTVKATITDKAGNTSKEGSDKAKLDTSDLTIGLEVIIYEDAGLDKKYGTNDKGENDEIISSVELDGQVDVRVMLPKAVKAGDVLTITASGNISEENPLKKTLKESDIKTDENGNKYIDFEFNSLADGSDFTVTAIISDDAGNTSNKVDDYAKFDLTAPDAPIAVQITEDKNDDGYITPDELEGTIEITVTLPQTAIAGDVAHIDIDGDGKSDYSKVLTSDDVNKNTVVFDEMPQSRVKDNIVHVDAWLTDEYGNQSNKANDEANIVNNACIAYPVNKPEINKDEVVCGNATASATIANLAPATDGVVYTITPNEGVTIDATTGKITGLVYFEEYVVTATRNGCVKSSDPFSIEDKESCFTVKTVSNATAVEGDNLVHTVTLSHSRVKPQVFDFELAEGDNNPATVGKDYKNTPTFSNGVTYDPATKKITVPAGVKEFTVSYPTIDDVISDNNETTKLTIGGKVGIGTITDEAKPYDPTNPTDPDAQDAVYAEISVDKPSTPEGTKLTYTVKLVDKDGKPVVVPADKPVKVNLVWSGDIDTSANHLDTSELPKTITIPAGKSQETFVIDANTADLAEGTEPIIATIDSVVDDKDAFEAFEKSQDATKIVANSEITDTTGKPTVTIGNKVVTEGEDAVV
ncbi:MAG: hypothetical protein KGV44_04630, partial [Flavobacteriaceae bacterium]|nr:hypothetical protein [Flavobacteriaceae bacterium]